MSSAQLDSLIVAATITTLFTPLFLYALYLLAYSLTHIRRATVIIVILSLMATA